MNSRNFWRNLGSQDWKTYPISERKISWRGELFGSESPNDFLHVKIIDFKTGLDNVKIKRH
jgi:hypothetical protein